MKKNIQPSSRKSVENDQNVWLDEVKNCKKVFSNRGKAVVSPKRVKLGKNYYVQTIDSGGYGNGDCGQSQISAFKLEKNKSLGIDGNTDKKLRAGKIKIDMKIDFHGLTSERALDMLVDSVDSAYRIGLKCILVVTGKGTNTSLGKTSIKSQLEKWMQIPAVSSRVIKYVDAQQRHGGKGAVYILLKTNRQLPSDIYSSDQPGRKN
ncbi:MAG: Smr/MutS family protein [Rickettsiales bacterium]|nr:Smr/MutS family protein [Rickettsiales bacterium]